MNAVCFVSMSSIVTVVGTQSVFVRVEYGHEKFLLGCAEIHGLYKTTSLASV